MIAIWQLIRHEDETGISGTGLVVEAAQFNNGKVAVAWLVGEHQSVAIYDSIKAAEAIHGHGGKTEFRRIDASRASIKEGI